MSTVYLLMKHPKAPFGSGYLDVAEVMGVYTSRTEPDRIAAEKNARRPYYLWSVQRKQLKGAAHE